MNIKNKNSLNVHKFHRCITRIFSVVALLTNHRNQVISPDEFEMNSRSSVAILSSAAQLLSRAKNLNGGAHVDRRERQRGRRRIR